MFRSEFAESIFKLKGYAKPGYETWPLLARRVVEEVCEGYLTEEEQNLLFQFIRDMKFLPGGRYLYYAGRKAKYWNNCYLLKAVEDTREDWADLTWKVQSCLMTGGGVGVDYSVYRPGGATLGRTGGTAAGPLNAMQIMNELGKLVRQGGSRRSALWSGLSWQHPDAPQLLTIKNWGQPVASTGYNLRQLKRQDFGFPAPLDATNISLLYDDDFLEQIQRGETPELFKQNITQALSTGEPGMCFDFKENGKDTARNACGELCSADDSDVCCLGSLNLSRIGTLEEFKTVIELATKFLVCGTLRSEVPYTKVAYVRDKNRRLGLGLMGLHEWLLQRGYSYEVTSELEEWLTAYQQGSDNVADIFCDSLCISKPKGKRAIAPSGSISMLAGTTSGIEPLYAVSYKRRFLEGNVWKQTVVVDNVAKYLIERGVAPDKIETALSLAQDPERRLAFQAGVQRYVDHCISSTVNLPPWGSEYNNPDTLPGVVSLVKKYCTSLRGLTFYPDGAIGGQPIVPIPYEEACKSEGQCVVEGHDVCSIAHKATCEA